jgi:hypothetical protein
LGALFGLACVIEIATDTRAGELSPRVSHPPPRGPPSPPPEPPVHENGSTASTSAHARPQNGDKSDTKSKKKFQRNTLPFIGALGALLDEAKDGAPTPPEEPPEEDDDAADEEYALASRSPLDATAVGPDGQPIDTKVREILRLQDEVARQRRVRNAPSPNAQPTKSILKKSGEKNGSGGEKTEKEKRSFFKFGSSAGLTKSSEKLNKSDNGTTGKGGAAAESTRRARVRFTDSNNTREERLAQAALSQSAPAVSKLTTTDTLPPPPKAPRASSSSDDSPPPSPPPADSSPVYRRTSASSTPKSKALDAAWRSIEQDLFD